MTMKRNELRNALTLIALAFGAVTLPAQATNAGSSGSSASGSASSASDASSSGTNAAAAAAAPAGGTNSGGPSNNSAARIAGTNMPPTAAAPAAPMSAADQQLAASVNSALAADEKLKDAQLKVYSSNGNVTLSGTVKDQAQGDHAMQLARSISGVKNVTPSIVITSG